jgi:hypothetical protein
MRLRVELPDTEERFDKIVDRLGSSQVQVATRLVRWYARQPDSIQLAMMYNTDGAIREMILRSLAKNVAK